MRRLRRFTRFSRRASSFREGLPLFMTKKPRWAIPALLALNIPVLGICYGLQWIAHTLGGDVQRSERREYGPAELDIQDGSALFAGFPKRLKIWMSHGDHVRVRCLPVLASLEPLAVRSRPRKTKKTHFRGAVSS